MNAVLCWLCSVVAWLAPALLLGESGAGSGVCGARRNVFTGPGGGVWVVEKDGPPRRISDSAVHWMAVVSNGRAGDFGPKFEVIKPQGLEVSLVLASDQ